MVHINLIPDSGFFDTVFHKTWFAINVFGLPTNDRALGSGGPVSGGYGLSLAGLIIILLLAGGVLSSTQRLTGAKPGGLALGLALTLLGSWLFQSFVTFGYDVVLEGVRLIAAFVGALIVAVFYTLIRKQMQGAGGGAKH